MQAHNPRFFELKTGFYPCPGPDFHIVLVEFSLDIEKE